MGRLICKAAPATIAITRLLLATAVCAAAVAHAPASAAVIWSNGCDSIDGWMSYKDSYTFPSILTTGEVHSQPGAWGYTNRQNRVCQGFSATSGPCALRFWLYDSSLAYVGDAPVVQIHASTTNSTVLLAAGVNTSTMGGNSKYACKITGGGLSSWYAGSALRSVGWHRLELFYKETPTKSVNLYVDGEPSLTKSVTSALSLGAVSVGLGLSSSAYGDDFRCDTISLLGAPRQLTFEATGGDINVSVNGVAFAQKNGLYDQDEIIQLTAIPDPGSSFVGWTSTAGGTFSNSLSATATFSGATCAGTIVANFASGATLVERVSDLWELTNGPFYKMVEKTVTGVVGNAFWIEETDRSSAIKVVYSGTMPAQNHSVDVTGSLDSSSGQRVLNATAVTDNGAVDAIKPLGVIERSVGGKQVNANTPSITGGTGLYNVGMLVRIAGTAGNANTTDDNNKYFYLDDGSGLLDGAISGIKVLCGSVTPPSSGNVTVTGLVGVVGGKPVIFIRTATDIFCH